MLLYLFIFCTPFVGQKSNALLIPATGRLASLIIYTIHLPQLWPIQKWHLFLYNCANIVTYFCNLYEIEKSPIHTTWKACIYMYMVCVYVYSQDPPLTNLVCVASPELAYKRSHLSCFKGCYLASSLRRFCINVYYNVQMPRTFFFFGKPHSTVRATSPAIILCLTEQGEHYYAVRMSCLHLQREEMLYAMCI